MQDSEAKIKRVVVIGGGTGSFVVLTGLKAYPLQITAVITTMDSGGSTGRLRDQLGVLPPGDLRQALVALSDSEKIWRDLFTYRFETGDLAGHNFGNIFISALEKITGSFESAIELAAYILDTKGNVVPVTTSTSEICAVLKNGKVIKSERLIDDPDLLPSPIQELYLDKPAFPNPRALRAIKQADFIIFGPGDLYTSIVPNLLVSDITRVIRSSKAKKIYIANLMTKKMHTAKMGVKEHVDIIESYLGSKIDYVLLNKERIPVKLAKWYKKTADSEPVIDNMKADSTYRVIKGDFVNNVAFEQSVADRVKRSILRHDSKKLASELYKIFVS